MNIWHHEQPMYRLKTRSTFLPRKELMSTVFPFISGLMNAGACWFMDGAAAAAARAINVNMAIIFIETPMKSIPYSFTIVKRLLFFAPFIL
jgi:hypothetical protein